MNVSSTSTLVFCPPPLGKPDPKLPKPLYGPDIRPRVLQEKSKSLTCWYYVFNRIRERYKAPNISENFKLRQLECIVSKWRKSMSNIDTKISIVLAQIMAKDTLEKFTKQEVQKERHRAFLSAHYSELVETVPGFLQQIEHSNLYDYLCACEYNKRNEINLAFFSEYAVATGQDIPSFMASCKKMKGPLLEQALRITCALDYHLEVSSWSPEQPATEMIKELKKNGPLTLNGFYGTGQYKVPPTKLKRKIQGREVYAWSKGDRLSGGGFFIHTILIVGAEILNGKGYVYYIDPTDGSDPAHPEKERIFAISYETLTSPEVTCNNWGVRGHVSTPHGYAFCRKKERLI